ncbi:MAG: serine protein kinase RIO [Candidatus Nanohaloarchaea archaeon]
MDEENRDFEERWREESRRMFDSSEARKAVQNVLEDSTLDTLLKMSEDGVIEKLYGTIESGKESVVFLADTSEGERVIVKIYMTRAGSFREMKDYLRGDKRFRNFRDDRRSVIYEWAKKEYRNLQKAREVLRCPEPLAIRNNVLVMEFIGKDFSPYPKLKDVEIENPQEAYEMTLECIKSLWNECKLVHGDLSEYNILVAGDSLVWIDFSQGVHVTHPEAEKLLRRDIENIADFFERQGAKPRPEKAFQSVISPEDGLNQ